ncbi:MAG: hypothetical protein JSR54_06140 [Proteobacteria bacterium]|nr:hypothetical protein [Pseudomonadota bacterium]
MRRRAQLAARREVLTARSARLRDDLSADAAALGLRFRIADRLVALAQSGGGRALLVGGAALVFLGRPRRVLRLALRGLALWPLVAHFWPRIRRALAERGAPAPSA